MSYQVFSLIKPHGAFFLLFFLSLIVNDQLNLGIGITRADDRSIRRIDFMTSNLLRWLVEKKNRAIFRVIPDQGHVPEKPFHVFPSCPLHIIVGNSCLCEGKRHSFYSPVPFDTFKCHRRKDWKKKKKNPYN